MLQKIRYRGSLHSHGCWTDYRNPTEQKKFPFNLETFVEYCISCGRDFQAITDIMACKPGKPEFIEQRYRLLLATADKHASYSVESDNRGSIIYLPSGKKFGIPRSQEILTATHFKHVLAVGAEKDVHGGKLAFDTLKEIRDTGGYIVIDHPFMCGAWTEEEIIKLYEQKLIDAIEWNGGLSWPAWISLIMKKVPSKMSNKKAIELERNFGVPCITNDDSHCKADIQEGAYTSYNLNDSKKQKVIDRIFEAIKQKDFHRQEKYSSFFSPLVHVKFGRQSRKMFIDKGLPDA